MSRVLQVRILEPDLNVHENLENAYSELFSIIGYDARIVFVRDVDVLRKAIATSDCDVFICDLSFQSDGRDYMGLRVIETIKTEFPDICCVGNTSGDISYKEAQSRAASFDFFVDKGGLLAQSLATKELFQRNFVSTFQKVPNVDVVRKNLDPRAKRDEDQPSDRDVRSLVEQVLWDGDHLGGATSPSFVTLRPLSGGRSGSYVFQMQVRDREGKMPFIPAVIKISKRDSGRIEHRNYQKYVKWRLPYTWRVDVLGTGETEKWFAICYSFILSGLSEFDSLTKYMEDEDYERVLDTIETMFDPKKEFWYSNLLCEQNSNINQRYRDRYFSPESKLTDSIRSFKYWLPQLYSAEIKLNSIVIEEVEFPNPERALFDNVIGDYFTSLCHGDLNGNNIILSENNQIILIDFQDTGRGHVFEDFITLESSIRLSYGTHGDDTMRESADETLEAELSLAKFGISERHSERYRLIQRVRDLAFENFPEGYQRNYLYGVAAFQLRLLRLPDLSRERACRLVASTLTSLREVKALGNG